MADYSDVTLGDVADPLECVFCGGNELFSLEQGWYGCEECSASVKYSQRQGMIVDDEYPEDLHLVSELLHKLRREY